MLELGPGLTFFDYAPPKSECAFGFIVRAGEFESGSAVLRRERGVVLVLLLYSEYALQYLRSSGEISTLEVEDL